jgi:DNA-binding MurR/RpiR family transcriptional regulator
LAAARRGETLLVVSPSRPGVPLLERVHDARRAGATVLALGPDEDGLSCLAHESLTVPDGSELDLDTVQHLVSAAAGENALPAPRGRRRLKDRLSRLADHLTAPPPTRW